MRGKTGACALECPGKVPIQFKPINGKKKFLIVDDDNNTRLKPAVFRRGLGDKTIGALWLFLRMEYGSVVSKKCTLMSHGYRSLRLADADGRRRVHVYCQNDGEVTI
jgi:hypothetical protein